MFFNLLPIYLRLLLLGLILCQHVAWSIGPSVDIVDCSAEEYLDITNLQCYSCTTPPNIGSDSSEYLQRAPNENSLLRPYPTRNYSVATACTCNPGWILNQDDLFTNTPCLNGIAESQGWCDAFRCESCPEASTLDGNTCLPCGDSSPGSTISFDSTAGVCVCANSNHALVERDAVGGILDFKVCEECPDGSVLRSARLQSQSDAGMQVTITEADYYICEPCPHPKQFVVNATCLCSLPSDPSPEWTEVGVTGFGEGTTCILTSELISGSPSDYATVVFTQVVSADDILGIGSFRSLNQAPELGRHLQDGQLRNLQQEFTSYTVRNSLVFLEYFPIAGSRCRYPRDAQGLVACNALANLCSLQMFDIQTDACSLYSTILSQRPQWIDSTWDWKLMTPWIFYSASPPVVLNDTGIETEFSFRGGQTDDSYQFLDYILARYALNGTFLGFANLSSQFEFCRKTTQDSPRWLDFGYRDKIEYNCNLYNLITTSPEPEFYDMYLVDYSNQGAYYPVPVINKNLREGDEFPNEILDLNERSNSVLVRRFFLYDRVSSVTNIGDPPSVIRYAKSIRLTVETQEANSARILPPRLEIIYEEQLTEGILREGLDQRGDPVDVNGLVRVTFEAEYIESYSSFLQVALIVFVIIVSLVAMFSVLKLFNWNQRNTRLVGEGQIDFVFLFKALHYLASTFSKVIFWFLFGISAYIFVFFKMQSTLLLPSNSSGTYTPFYILLQTCFFGQLFNIFTIIIWQSRCDIFLLDWEKPRGRVPVKEGDFVKGRHTPVSVWRTLLICNELSELQTRRRYDVRFAMLLMALLLVGTGLQYSATFVPNFRDLAPGELNIVLRFFNTSILYLLIVCTELLLRYFIVNRFILENPSQSFVDLCTMAKISVLILDEKYHGYYLHCRSQHEHADCSMLELTRQLNYEEKGLTVDRGMPNCPVKSIQAFEIFVSGNWKLQYNHIYRNVLREQEYRQKSILDLIPGYLSKSHHREAPERLVKASRNLNAFLRSFIDQTNNDFPLYHHSKTFAHRFFHVTPAMVESIGSFFYPDSFYEHVEVFFYGQTWNLAIFNMLCIATFDFWGNNTMLSIFLAFIVDAILTELRFKLGNANLSSKSLIDGRFLTKDTSFR